MKWEYLFVTISGKQKDRDQDKALRLADDMLVTTSDGRWSKTRMPIDPAGFINELGAEGWEMVNCGGASDVRDFWPLASHLAFDAVFKRSAP